MINTRVRISYHTSGPTSGRYREVDYDGSVIRYIFPIKSIRGGCGYDLLSSRGKGDELVINPTTVLSLNSVGKYKNMRAS